MPERVFLGSDTHLLPACAQWLIDQVGVSDGVIDLKTHLVAFPTSRAKRRMERLLLAGAHSAQARLAPPDLLTVGRLLERLCVPGTPMADAATSDLAWMLAVTSADDADLAILTGHDGPWSSTERRRLASRLSVLSRQAAAADLGLSEVSGRLEQAGLPADPQRWKAASSVAAAMQTCLRELGLGDRDEQQADAIESERLHLGDLTHVHIISADLPPRTARLLARLEASGMKVSRLVHGEHASGFDDQGELDIDWWCACDIDLEAARLTPCDLVEDQIAVAFDHLAGLGDVDAHTTRIVIPDEELLKPLEAAARLEHVPLSRFDGRTVRDGRVGRFLELVADVIEDDSAATLGALIRHGDVESWLIEQGHSRPVVAWDKHWSSRLPDRVEDATADFADDLKQLIDPLRGSAVAAAWPQRIADVLAMIFERPTAAAGRTPSDLGESLAAVQEVLTSLHELPESGVEIPCVDVLHTVLSQLEHATISDEDTPGGVEVLGWLDAHLDDAPDILVTGMNAMTIPGSPETDAWLTQSQRDALGLPSVRRRTARDAYLLHAMLQSGREVHLTWARRTSQGDPIAPSSLLLRARGLELAERVEYSLVDDLPSDVPNLAVRLAQGGGSDDQGELFDSMPVPSGHPVIEAIPVSAFRLWLRSPYDFLLARDGRIGARTVELSRDLDPGAFGTLVHRALQAWGEGEREASTPTCDAATIRDDMHAALDRITARHFGAKPLPSVALQIAAARYRLSALAQVQARHASDGWRIVHLERAFKHPGDAPRFPSRDGLYISGTIDRIDQHDELGWCALDYKTSIEAKGPMAVHGKPGAWRDLQLPLYRVLAASAGLDVAPTALGYVLVPPDQRQCRVAWARWTEQDMVDAESTAAELVEQLVNGTFMDTVHAEIREGST